MRMVSMEKTMKMAKACSFNSNLPQCQPASVSSNFNWSYITLQFFAFSRSFFFLLLSVSFHRCKIICGFAFANDRRKKKSENCDAWQSCHITCELDTINKWQTYGQIYFAISSLKRSLLAHFPHTKHKINNCNISFRFFIQFNLPMECLVL